MAFFGLEPHHKLYIGVSLKDFKKSSNSVFFF